MNTNSLLLWPLVVTLEDVFVPDVAKDVLSAVADYSDEDSRAQLTCAAYEAEGELMRN
jgi:hypothetical protein